jgi:hypothetical protein
MSHRAIGQQLKITEEAAKSRVRRAQQRVCRLLGPNSTANEKVCHADGMIKEPLMPDANQDRCQALLRL